MANEYTDNYGMSRKKMKEMREKIIYHQMDILERKRSEFYYQAFVYQFFNEVQEEAKMSKPILQKSGCRSDVNDTLHE